MNQENREIIQRLWSGGRYGTFTTINAAGRVTGCVVKANEPEKWPSIPTGKNYYFSVNSAIDHPSDFKGKIALRHLQVIGAFFGEFDAKDFDGDMAKAYDHVLAIEPQPSIIINSGGGYHTYWLLEEPVIINNDEELAELNQAHHRWVEWVGGDEGAKDLSRILRVPGSVNNKPERDKAPITVVKKDLEATFPLEYLTGLSEPKPEPVALYAKGGGEVNRVTTYVNMLDDWRAEDYDSWLNVGMVIKHELGEEGFFLWNTFSQRAPNKYPGIEKLKAKWNSFSVNSKNPLTIGSLISWAKNDSPDAFSHALKPEEAVDSANGQAYAKAYGDKVAYIDGLGFSTYQDGVWTLGDHPKLIARQYAHEFGSTFFERAERVVDRGEKAALQKWGRHSLLKTGVDATLNEARPYIYRPISLYDTRKELLNLANGVIDLATGEFFNHSPDYHFTQKARFWYDESATCPRWLEMLDMIFEGDAELIRYVQAAMGWTITGRSDKKVLFFMYGPEGDNGKTTIIETLAWLLDNYALKTQAKTVMSLGAGNGDSFVAQFRGKRLVYTSETEEGMTWSSSLIKDITGGDAISAKLLYENPFTFLPSHTLWVYGNTKPEANDTSDAFWNRMKPIPFRYSIPKEKQRPLGDVKQEFYAEGAGILNWLMAGYQDELANNILRKGEPQAVRNEVESYRLDSDPLQQFLESECERGADESVNTKILYDRFSHWLETEYLMRWTKTKFTQELAKKGIRRGGAARASYLGVTVK